MSEGFNRLQSVFKQAGIVSKLIYINIALFLIYHLFNTIIYFSGSDFLLYQYFAIPSDLSLFIKRPWTIITYMFFHQGILHILFNMLVLFWTGTIFVQWFNRSRLLAIYILGGVSGALLYLIAYNVIPQFSSVLSDNRGASAAVMAIVCAIATYRPNSAVNLFPIGAVKLKWIAIGYIVLDLIFMADGNAGGHIAHLGGALAGFIYVSLYKKNIDILSFTRGIGKSFKRKNIKVVHKRNDIDIQYNRAKTQRNKDIDRVLDKISKTGYDSLTKEEKEILFTMGKKN